MSKKIGLHIGGRRFDVDVEENFAHFLEQKMAEDFNIDGNNDIKILLQGYVRKVHELYQHNNRIDKIEKKIEEKL
jgi:hypothetical protein